MIIMMFYNEGFKFKLFENYRVKYGSKTSDTRKASLL